LSRVVWRLDTDVSEDRATSMVFRNVGIQPPHYTAQKTHRTTNIFTAMKTSKLNSATDCHYSVRKLNIQIYETIL